MKLEKSRKKLSKENLDWLTSRGGRTAQDVYFDFEGSAFVFMGDGSGGYKQVFLPCS